VTSLTILCASFFVHRTLDRDIASMAMRVILARKSARCSSVIDRARRRWREAAAIRAPLEPYPITSHRSRRR
jgi:hypothetical protein